MTNFNKFSTLIILFLGFSFSIFAQRKGYIITMDKDTIQGEFEAPKNPDILYRYVKFKSNDSKYKKFKANKIKGYTIGTDRYFSGQNVLDDLLFVKIELEGRVNLFTSLVKSYIVTPNGSAPKFDKVYFWSKDKGLVRVYSRDKKSLLEVIGDNQRCMEIIQSSKKKDIDIPQLVKIYNQ